MVTVREQARQAADLLSQLPGTDYKDAADVASDLWEPLMEVARSSLQFSAQRFSFEGLSHEEIDLVIERLDVALDYAPS